MIEENETEEYEYPETSEEEIPVLGPLSLGFTQERVERPSRIYVSERKWQGLDMETPIKPGEYIEPGIVTIVELPDVSTKIESIPEARHEIADPGTILSQEDIFKVVDKIDIDKLAQSIVGGKKAGFTLSELNTYAKQLGVPVTGLKKVGMSKRIMDRIKLKIEEEI